MREYGGKLDERADDWIRRTVASTRQLETILRDVVTYSDIESRSAPFALTNLSGVFDQVRVILAPSIDADASVTRDELPTVMADRSQLIQLLQNLIGNAIKFRGKNPLVIHVSAARSETDWVISVRDNGIGIPSEYLNNVFEIFHRLHTRKEYPGSGIGLAICRRVVERHGGRISAESELGRGSTFYFTLPHSSETL
jgi:light-regulated signal transduction histidine kinase (bacteriophytochrome)